MEEVTKELSKFNEHELIIARISNNPRKILILQHLKIESIG